MTTMHVPTAVHPYCVWNEYWKRIAPLAPRETKLCWIVSTKWQFLRSLSYIAREITDHMKWDVVLFHLLVTGLQCMPTAVVGTSEHTLIVYTDYITTSSSVCLLTPQAPYSPGSHHWPPGPPLDQPLWSTVYVHSCSWNFWTHINCVHCIHDYL